MYIVRVRLAKSAVGDYESTFLELETPITFLGDLLRV